MPRTCLNVFNSRDADEPASVAPGYYAYPYDDYDRKAVGPFATPALAIGAARALEDQAVDLGMRGCRAQPFNVATSPDDELVFVEFAPASQVEGHGFPVEIGPQYDAHADAWLDALNLHAPSGYRAGADYIDDFDRREASLDALVADYHAAKLARPVPAVSPEQAIADIIAALPPAATEPAPVAGSRVI